MKVQTFLLSRNLLIFCLHSAQNLLIYDILIQTEKKGAHIDDTPLPYYRENTKFGTRNI